MKTIKQNSRFLLIDVLRGFTVVLMIIFHFSFDLNYFRVVVFDILHHPFWYLFPRVIVFLFLFATGMSLQIAHSEKIHWRKFLKRLGLLVFWALIISATTYFLFPDYWIYFGTLHAIAVVSVISLFFLNRPYVSLVVALALFLPSIFLDYNLPWFELPHPSWDYISPFPWMGASLIGIFAVHKGMHQKFFLSPVKLNTPVRCLKFLGQHSLIIYLIHQPILFGLVALGTQLIHS